MKIEKFVNTGVNKDGIIEGGGAVITDGGIRMSPPNGGCTIETCSCSEGHWLSIILPRTEDGVVEGVKVKFDSAPEMTQLLGLRTLNA